MIERRVIRDSVPDRGDFSFDRGGARRPENRVGDGSMALLTVVGTGCAADTGVDSEACAAWGPTGETSGPMD